MHACLPRTGGFGILCGMERYFNVAGPCIPGEHYMLPAGYLDSLGLSEGWMAIFDEDKSRPWEEKLYNRDVAFNGKTLHVVGL